MGRLERLFCARENGQLIYANTENGRWVKMPQKVYQQYQEKPFGRWKLENYLQDKYRLFQKTENNAGLLHSVYFAVTGRCNMRCGFCTMNAGPDIDAGNELTRDEILDVVIPKLKKLNPKKIVLTGGEPFTRVDIMDIIGAFGMNFDRNIITLQTNGLLLTSDMPEQLAGSVGAIEFSIESLFYNPEQLRQMRGVFDACKAAGIALSFSYVVTDHTVAHIEAALDLCHEYRAGFTLRMVSMLGRARTNNRNDRITQENCKMEIYLRLLRYIIARKYYEETITGMFLFQPQLRKYCGAYGNICAIHADGRVYMCENFKEKRYTLGNIREDELCTIQRSVADKIRTDSYIREFADAKSDICGSCNAGVFCSGSCIAEKAENPTTEMDTCLIKSKLLHFNLFYKDKDKTTEENLKKLLVYMNVTETTDK